MGAEINLEAIAEGGFFLPILTLVNSMLTYVFTQLINALANAFPKTIPSISSTMSLLILFFGIVVGLAAFADYFKDFGEGWKYPGKSLLYSAFGIVGLRYFWTPLSNTYPKEIGSDVIWSTIFTIVILVFSSLLSIYKQMRT